MDVLDPIKTKLNRQTEIHHVLFAADEVVPLIYEIVRLRGLLDEARSLVTLVAQPDASLPPYFNDNDEYEVMVTIADVRAARALLESPA